VYTDPRPQNEDRNLDKTLRPYSFEEYFGQEKIKKNLKILLEAAKQRKEAVEHILLYGGSGLGKCINKDSIIFSEKGMLPIGKFGNLSKRGFQKKRIKIYSNPGPQKTSHFYNNGKSRTIKIRTHQGYELEGTPNHPIIVLNKNGEKEFRQLQNIKKCDYVAIQRGQNYFGREINLPKFDFRIKKMNKFNYSNCEIPAKMTPELARLCGYLIGDGYMGDKSGVGALSFNNSDDEILKDFQKLWLKVFGQKTKIKKWKTKCPTIRVSNLKIRQFLINMGLPFSTAKTKDIPFSIMVAPKEIVKEFLSAYVECDGHIRPDCRQIDVSSASKQLLKKIQIVLLNFGIISRIYEDFSKIQGKSYWRLYITGGDVDIFNKEIGFVSSRKRNAQKDFKAEINTNKDLVPHGIEKIKEIKKQLVILGKHLHKKGYRTGARKEASHEEINKCLDIIRKTMGEILEKTDNIKQISDPDIFWDRIETLEEGSAHTLDFSIPSNHTFFANGFINHNTTLAHIIARELGTNIRITSGPAIEKIGDLASILTNLEKGDILFIDECHRLNKLIEEYIYPAMEEFSLNIIIGKGPSARTIQLELPPFTLIAATTRISLLSSPLRNRFGATYHLDFYEPEDIENILKRSSKILKIEAEESGIKEIAKRARRTPRVANRLLKRVRDYAQVHGQGKISKKISQEALAMLEIDDLGLEPVDRLIISTIIEKFNGGPVGLDAIAAATSEEKDTIAEIYEPYLMQIGFLARTSQGRITTHLAYKHLGLKSPKDIQKKLIE